MQTYLTEGKTKHYKLRQYQQAAMLLFMNHFYG